MGRRGGVLALDLSSWVGWAYGFPGDIAPLTGVWELPKGDLGRLLASFENELEDAIVFHDPRLIVAEAPIAATAVSNQNVWRQQLSLSGAAQTAAWRHEIHYREAASSTIRKEVMGSKYFPGGDAKPAIMQWCLAQGWDVYDHNAGDAAITWLYQCRHMPAGLRLEAA